MVHIFHRFPLGFHQEVLFQWAGTAPTVLRAEVAVLQGRTTRKRRGSSTRLLWDMYGKEWTRHIYDLWMFNGCLMDVYGCLWMCMDVYGCVWMVYMDVYGLWTFMDVYGRYIYIS